MRKIIASAAASLACVSAFAHGPGPAVRYRVEEVRPPASMLAPCVPGYRIYAQGTTINDLGVAAGNFNCYSQIDPATAASTFSGGPFV